LNIPLEISTCAKRFWNWINVCCLWLVLMNRVKKHIV